MHDHDRDREHHDDARDRDWREHGGDWRDHDRRAGYVDHDRGWREHDRDWHDRDWRDHRVEHRRWHRGDPIPAEYRDHRHDVDWRAYRLQAPPRGYHWVRVDGGFVLAALATGVVVDVLLNQ